MINAPHRLGAEPPAEQALGGAGRPIARSRREQPRQLIPLPISILLHAAVIAFLILAIHRSLLHAPPAQPGIAVVFQSSGLTKSATKNAAPKAEIHAPPAIAANSAPAPSPPPAAASAPPEVRLSAPAQSQPTPDLSHLPAPQPHPHAAPQHNAPRHLPAPRYMVMNGMSFGTGAHAPSPPSRINGRLALQLPQSDLLKNGPEVTFKGKAGPDWESEFVKWVNEHKYYPLGAAENDQQGSVTIAMTVLPDGSVTDLHLVKSSGAPLLDMGWLGLFRGVHVPPFPPNTKAKSEHIVGTMHYILIH